MLRYRGHEKSIYGAERNTTNNRMELMAAIRGLEALTRPSRVNVTTDSRYLKQGICEWLPRWKARGWRTTERTAVKNADLWRRLEAAAARHDVHWHWVRGHRGHAGNEQADALANRAIDEMLAGGERRS